MRLKKYFFCVMHHDLMDSLFFFINLFGILSLMILMKIVYSFYDIFLDLKRINLAFICLIPKKQDANLITQYRPISLINYSVKIITKALTERLTPLMDTLLHIHKLLTLKEDIY
jgi:hypothetical protein